MILWTLGKSQYAIFTYFRSKSLKMATIPLLFTLDGSARHDIILVTYKSSLHSIAKQVTEVSASSPNCQEFMSKYKTEEGREVSELKVRWGTFGRDTKFWPATTVVTQHNCEAILKILDPAKDILEVTFGGK
jgi:hypothetical protein